MGRIILLEYAQSVKSFGHPNLPSINLQSLLQILNIYHLTHLALGKFS